MGTNVVLYEVSNVKEDKEHIAQRYVSYVRGVKRIRRTAPDATGAEEEVEDGQA